MNTPYQRCVLFVLHNGNLLTVKVARVLSGPNLSVKCVVHEGPQWNMHVTSYLLISFAGYGVHLFNCAVVLFP